MNQSEGLHITQKTLMPIWKIAKFGCAWMDGQWNTGHWILLEFFRRRRNGTAMFISWFYTHIDALFTACFQIGMLTRRLL